MRCLHPICALVPRQGGRVQFLPQTDFPRGECGPLGKCVYIPCGKCLPCRINRRRELTCLQSLEALSASRLNWFLTLTYDDVKYWEKLEDFPYSLEKGHLRDFCFSLRKHFHYLGRNFRYFGCGEYGEANMRPHYHLSLFDLSEDDLQLPHRLSLRDRDFALNRGKLLSNDLVRDENGFPVFRSPLIDKFWPFGHYKLSLASSDTFQYVAGYVLKKLSGDKLADFKLLNLTPEFVYQSRPSIGYYWWRDNWQYLFNPDSNIRIVNSSLNLDGKEYPIPRVFWRWFDSLDPDARSVRDRLFRIHQKDLPSVPDRLELARYKRFQDHKAGLWSASTRGLRGYNDEDDAV